MSLDVRDIMGVLLCGCKTQQAIFSNFDTQNTFIKQFATDILRLFGVASNPFFSLPIGQAAPLAFCAVQPAQSTVFGLHPMFFSLIIGPKMLQRLYYEQDGA